MSDKVRVGVIGVGGHGENHLKSYTACPDTELTAICDLDEELLAKQAAQYSVGQTFRDFREMLAEAPVDAVSIVLPDHLHRTAAEAAFAAGKHVLLEKPMATTVEDAEAIYRAWKQAGTKLMINWSNRWMPSFAGTKAALDAGELGEPLYIYARLSNTLFVPTKLLSWAANTKLPFWLICHRLDIVRWYAGCEATRVTAVCRSRVLKGMGIDTPDFYQATVEFESGLVANLESCWVLPESLPSVVDSKFQLICTKGYVNVDPVQPSYVKASSGDQGPQLTMGTPLLGEVMGQPWGFVYHALCHFVECVRDDTEPLITGEDGLAITKILCAIETAAETGQALEL